MVKFVFMVIIAFIALIYIPALTYFVSYAIWKAYIDVMGRFRNIKGEKNG